MLAVIRRYSILAARWMGSVMTFLVCVGMVPVCILSMQGYAMYERAIKQKPVRCLVEQLHSDPSFVTIDQLPEIYVDAVVAVEDKRFWSHGGVDPLATARALGYDIFTLSFAQGGSTITQQLAKKSVFYPGQNAGAKICRGICRLGAGEMLYQGRNTGDVCQYHLFWQRL